MNRRRTEARRKPRARDLGIPFDGTPGRFNAITDVAGVEVGHTTIVRGRGKLVVGRGPVRTGVTAVLPRGRRGNAPAFAGYFSQNGNGEMTGIAWVEESGLLTTPILLTNTHSVGIAHDAVIRWQVRRGSTHQPWSLPVIAETWDGYLNDINGFHVKAKDVWAALESGRSGQIEEGNVGGGTGMIGYGWKGGIGTASRKLSSNQGGYTIGVLVQLNCGLSHQLTIAGVPIGRVVRPKVDPYASDIGSIIGIVATDAPLAPHQLKRIARRLTIGLARTGSISGNFSGDLFLAFSTADLPAESKSNIMRISMLHNSRIDPLFSGAVEVTEEAIVNALVAAETMVGIEGRTVDSLPHSELIEVLRKNGRLVH